ncbi:MAG: BPL-N domain-containing protein [Nitrospiraceae bacterium]|nr:BPL-N domain-containing protein [Nitrospiraceae bacterium]
MSKAALLWDESYLWGLMACKSLSANHLPYSIIRSEDIRSGVLKDFSLLFVPGGWASNKLKALGESGAEEIRKFVKTGGSYLGICGGAGLATKEGLGLLDIARKPGSQRVPSFSGEIELQFLSDNKMWRSTKSVVFNAWWPSQFVVNDRSIKICAVFGDALPSSFSSDLNTEDVRQSGSWQELEALYEINLDPARLKGEPAVIEGGFGAGRVILSLVHFDSVDDANGAAVLKNIWLDAGISPLERSGISNKITEHKNSSVSAFECLGEGLMEFGLRNFLWFRRNSMLIQWRRGIRGLEYCTLYVMAKEIAALMRRISESEQALFELEINAATKLLADFILDAKRLLYLERLQMQQGLITYEKCPCAITQQMRVELFGSAKSHGGRFREVAAALDSIIFKLLAGV